LRYTATDSTSPTRRPVMSSVEMAITCGAGRETQAPDPMAAEQEDALLSVEHLESVAIDLHTTMFGPRPASSAGSEVTSWRCPFGTSGPGGGPRPGVPWADDRR
jgi:hypothetical protein